MKKKNSPKDKDINKPIEGGAPPLVEQPKPVNFTPSFSFLQLLFDGQFTVDNRKYFRFFVDIPDNPYFVTMTKSEYLDYVITYGDLFEQAVEANQDCLCDVCNPNS